MIMAQPGGTCCRDNQVQSGKHFNIETLHTDGVMAVFCCRVAKGMHIGQPHISSLFWSEPDLEAVIFGKNSQAIFHFTIGECVNTKNRRKQ